MPPASAQTVFGFGSGLDWRPTCFVNPFPSNRVCSVCGLVPSSAAMLPCLHLLCQSCYDGVDAKCDYCPLHREPFQKEDVVWSTFSTDSILARRVRCWNADNGCDVEDVASAMLEHFANTCRFHAVSCLRCNEKVLHRDTADHLKSGCVPYRACGQSLDDNFANAFTEVRETLDKILQENTALRMKLNSFENRLRPETSVIFGMQCDTVADIVDSVLRSYAEAASAERQGVRETLRKLSEENAAVQMKLALLNKDGAKAALFTIVSDALNVAVEKASSMCQTHVEAALARHRREFTLGVRDALANNERNMKEMISLEGERNMLELKDKLMEALAKERRLEDAGTSSSQTLPEKQMASAGDEVKGMELLALASLNISGDILNKSVLCELTIDDWDGFCEKASDTSSFTCNVDQPSYHYGYLIFARLCVEHSLVCLRVYVIEGLFDKFLEWPMDLKIKLFFINPSEPSKQLALRSEISPSGKHPVPKCSKEVVFVGSTKIMTTTKELIEHGLIGSNKLLVKFRFEP